MYKNLIYSTSIHIISVVGLLCFRARLFIAALWSPAGKGLTSWLLFIMCNCECVACFSIGIMGQVWYFIVSIPDLCPLSYFVKLYSKSIFAEGIYDTRVHVSVCGIYVLCFSLLALHVNCKE